MRSVRVEQVTLEERWTSADANVTMRVRESSCRGTRHEALELGPELEVARDAVELALERAPVGPRGVEMCVALGVLTLCLQLLRAHNAQAHRTRSHTSHSTG